MKYKEKYRRIMVACIRKVYDNDQNIIHLDQRPPRCCDPIGFSLPSLSGNPALDMAHKTICPLV